jgi:hypothetical protein
MKRARAKNSSRRRSPKRPRSETAADPARARPLTERKLHSPVRAARSAYINAFCAFLHSPAQ